MTAKGPVLAGMEDHWSLREVDRDDVIGDRARAEVDGLLPHQLHEFRAGHRVGMFFDGGKHVLAARVDRRFDEFLKLAGRKTGIVFDFGGLCELPHRKPSHYTVLFRHGSLEQERAKVRSSRIDGRGPTCRSTSNDDAIFGVVHRGVADLGIRPIRRFGCKNALFYHKTDRSTRQRERKGRHGTSSPPP